MLTFSCGLPEARATECDAWRQYERRYQAAQERGARDLALVIETDDTDLQRYLQAILAGVPGAMEGMRDFLPTRVAEYAEMLS